MTKRNLKTGYLLARVNFPPYSVQSIGERYVLIAGGGGMAKTGIANCFELYELVYDKSIDSCKAIKVARFDTGCRAIMNSTVIEHNKYFVLATGGMGESCLLYKLKYALMNGKTIGNQHERKGNSSEHNNDRFDGEGLRRRRLCSTSSTRSEEMKSSNENLSKSNQQVNESQVPNEKQTSTNKPDFLNIGFKIHLLQSFKTEFNLSVEECFLKCVRHSKLGNFLCTASADGYLRLWTYPECKSVSEVQAHTDEVDDIDIDASGKHITSISRDGHAYVWNITENGFTKACELEYVLPIMRTASRPIKYQFRNIRYGVMENNKNHSKIFTTLNPVVRQKPPNPSYICKWNTKTYIIERVVSSGPEVLSTMAISDDGRFIGIGTLTGSVRVYISYSLQQLYEMETAHNIFVTGVEFLKTCPEAQALTGDKDASLVSISVDNHVVIHHIPKQVTLSFLSSTFMFTVTLLIVYLSMDFLGL